MTKELKYLFEMDESRQDPPYLHRVLWGFGWEKVTNN